MAHDFFSIRGSKNRFVLLSGYKVDFIAPCGQINPFFLLAGHNVDFIALCGAKKDLFSDPQAHETWIFSTIWP